MTKQQETPQNQKFVPKNKDCKWLGESLNTNIDFQLLKNAQ